MTDHLLLSAVEEDRAVLSRKDGSILSVPVAWLPEGAKVGASLRVSGKPGRSSSEVTFEIDEGSTEPEGVNVGG